MTKRFYFRVNTPRPERGREEYIDARNLTEARKLIAADFRENTPPKSAGFYSFNECTIEWTRDPIDLQPAK